MNRLFVGLLTALCLITAVAGQTYSLSGYINGTTITQITPAIKLVFSVDASVPKPNGGDTATIYYVPGKGLYYAEHVSSDWAGTITPISAYFSFKCTKQGPTYDSAYLNPTPGSYVGMNMTGLNFTATAIPPTKVATPKATPGAEEIWPIGTTVSLSDDTAGATIMYSIGGVFAAYTTPISLTAATTLKAYATKAGNYTLSDTLTAVYTWTPAKLPTPKLSVPAGNIYPGAIDTLSDTLAAVIKYSINGAAFVSYTAPIHLTSATTIKAYATLPGYVSSDTVTAIYTWLTTKTLPRITTTRTVLYTVSRYGLDGKLLFRGVLDDAGYHALISGLHAPYIIQRGISRMFIPGFQSTHP